MIQITRRRRRIVPPLITLIVAAVVFAFTGRVDFDPFNESSRHRRGSGIYVFGHRVSFSGDQSESNPESKSPVTNPWCANTKSEVKPADGERPPVVVSP